MTNNQAPIYSFYEEGQKIAGDDKNHLFVCKLCKAKGIDKKIKAATTSNLISHLQTETHNKEYVKYETALKEDRACSTPPKIKRMRLENGYIALSPLTNSIISSSPKYSQNSIKQKER